MARSVLFKEKDKANSFSPTEAWCIPAPSVTNPEDRESVADSGASMHMLIKKDLNTAQMETVRVTETLSKVITANRDVQTNEEATVYVEELDTLLTVNLLEDTPAVLSLWKLCDEHGYSCEWVSGQLPHLVKKRIRIRCNTENHVPLVVPGLSTGYSSSTTCTSSTSSLQNSEKSTFLRSFIVRVQAVKHGETRCDTEKPNTELNMRTPIKYGETRCAICWKGWKISQRISWTKEFRHSGTHLKPLLVNQKQQRRKKWYGANTVFIFTSRRTEHLITADHKVLSEGCEPRNNHRCAVVIQNLDTPRIRAYLCKMKNSQETERSSRKFLEPSEKPQVITLTILWKFAKLVKNYPGIIVRPHLIVLRQLALLQSGTQNQGRNLCSSVAIRLGRKMVGRFHGVLLLSAKYTKQIVWWEDTIWKTFWWTI